MEIEGKVRDIFCNLFHIEPAQVHDKLSQADVDTWDSLQHLNLILAIEEAFGISITPEESTEMLNFSLVVLLVKEKLKTA